MAPINLERWYQDIMAAVEPPSCPPPLPAKSFSARRHGQVNSCFLPTVLDCWTAGSSSTSVQTDEPVSLEAQINFAPAGNSVVDGYRKKRL